MDPLESDAAQKVGAHLRIFLPLHRCDEVVDVAAASSGAGCKRLPLTEKVHCRTIVVVVWWISHYQIIMAMESLSWPLLLPSPTIAVAAVAWHPSRQKKILKNLSRISIDIAISLK